eukprot:4334856-Pyramimonas_sp.AAC.1
MARGKRQLEDDDAEEVARADEEEDAEDEDDDDGTGTCSTASTLRMPEGVWAAGGVCVVE